MQVFYYVSKACLLYKNFFDTIVTPENKCFEVWKLLGFFEMWS